MKKLFVLLLLGLSLGLAGCWPNDCGHNFRPELREVEASILMANCPASDLRLRLTLGVRQVPMAQKLPLSIPFIQSAYACSLAPIGFTDKTQIKEISLTCDKPIRGFAAGDNILTTTAAVYRFFLFPRYQNETYLTLGEWIYSVNGGDWGGEYDIAVAFIPKGTSAPAGDYTFSFSMKLRGGKTFTQTFDPVTITAS